MKEYLHILFFILTISIAFNQEIFEGYTLFTPQTGIGSGATTFLIDNEYNIIVDIQNYIQII